MRPVLVAADKIWKEHGKELVVTSGTDGEHSAGSKHYYGLALDFRTRYFTQAEQIKIYTLLLKELSEEYMVIKEGTHIHVHYKGEKIHGSVRVIEVSTA